MGIKYPSKRGETEGREEENVDMGIIHAKRTQSSTWKQVTKEKKNCKETTF